MAITDFGITGAAKRVLKKKKKKEEENQKVPPSPTRITSETTPSKEEPITTFEDVETGEISGVTLPDGRTILGKKSDILKVIEAEKAKQLKEAEILKGTISGPEQAKLEQVAGQVGEITPGEMPTEAEPLSQKQALTQAALSAVPGAIAGGAVPGAIAGAVAGAPLGPAALITGGIGAVTGFALSFYNSYKGNLNTQRGDLIRGRRIVLREAEQNLGDIINYVNTGGDPTIGLQDFNDQLSIIQQQYSLLYLDSRASPLTISQDATQELVRFEFFYAPGGARENLVKEMQIAILNPNPNKIIRLQQELEIE